MIDLNIYVCMTVVPMCSWWPIMSCTWPLDMVCVCTGTLFILTFLTFLIIFCCCCGAWCCGCCTTSILPLGFFFATFFCSSLSLLSTFLNTNPNCFCKIARNDFSQPLNPRSALHSSRSADMVKCLSTNKIRDISFSFSRKSKTQKWSK